MTYIHPKDRVDYEVGGVKVFNLGVDSSNVIYMRDTYFTKDENGYSPTRYLMHRFDSKEHALFILKKILAKGYINKKHWTSSKNQLWKL